MSNHVGEKFGKLYFQTTEIDETQTWLDVHNNKVTHKISDEHV